MLDLSLVPNDPEPVACSLEPDLWFSDLKADREIATRICLRCPIQKECAEFGETQWIGIWGGVDSSKSGLAEVRKIEAKRELVADVFALREEGQSLSAIGRQFGLSHSSVSALLAHAV